MAPDNLVLFPGSNFESEKQCFKVTVDTFTNTINIVSLPFGSGMKCYKLWLWLSKASIEKVSMKISSVFNQA